jgi:hypothetical protein
MVKSKLATSEQILREHLPYELWMLRETYVTLKSPPADDVLRNALIDAFCIHARQLLEFFDSKQAMHAKDFTGGIYAAANLSGLTKSERDKLNTQIAHVTAMRTIDPAEKIGHALRAKFLKALEREAQHFEGKLASEFQGMFKAALSIEVIIGATSPSATNAPTFTTTLPE